MSIEAIPEGDLANTYRSYLDPTPSIELQAAPLLKRPVSSADAMTLGDFILLHDDDGEKWTASLADTVRINMQYENKFYLKAIAENPIIEPPVDQRRTAVNVTQIEADATLPGWKPGRTYIYRSEDPFTNLNPRLVDATNRYIDATIDEATALEGTDDPQLTYLTLNRSAKGKRQTVLTELVKSLDPGIDDWISNLPDAERLRIVAKPWSDIPTLVRNEAGEITEIPQTKALQALVGSGGDGRAVREREGWEESVMERVIRTTELADNKLIITSIGTGTGEPAMDTAVASMEQTYKGKNYSIDVYGYDINPNSLAIAEYNAKNKGEALQFIPGIANILTAEGIQKVVGGTKAHVYEAIGFAEYVASDGAPTVMEQEQRKLMARGGCLSAQGFYREIYENMPVGSVLITGNMRDDSPQASFVIQGVGWKGIIQRSTSEYMRIIEEAGIPGEAVELFMPDPENSAAVYNLLAITKR